MPKSDELDELLHPAAVRADALRAAGLRGLLGITDAQQGALEREQARLAQKLGKDHPRVKAAGRRLEDGKNRMRDLGVEVSRAETVVPQVGADEWVLHGHVRWPDLEPAPGLTVSLVDAEGQWLRALGYGCTDAKGYFRLPVKLERSPKGAASAGLTAQIRVTDSKRKELYRGKEPVAVSPGAAEYREIILEGKGGSCTPPDDDVPAGDSTEPPSDSPPGRPKRRI